MRDLVEALKYYAGGDWPCPLECLDEAADVLELQHQLISELVAALRTVISLSTFDTQLQRYTVEPDVIAEIEAAVSKAEGIDSNSL
jgi:hypothetical protein